MKAKILLNAYLIAVNRCAYYTNIRPMGVIGIAVDNDKYAILWRRHNRQARTFWRRLVVVFGEMNTGNHLSENRMNAQRIKDRYNSDHNLSADVGGNAVEVTWVEYALLDMIESQQTQINALRHDMSEVVALRMDLKALKIEHQSELNSLKAQVVRLQDASPMGAPPRADGSNRGRNKLFKV